MNGRATVIGDLDLTSSSPSAYCAIPGDIGIRIKKKGGGVWGDLPLCHLVAFKGATESRPSNWRGRQYGGIPLANQYMCNFAMYRGLPGHSPLPFCLFKSWRQLTVGEDKHYTGRWPQKVFLYLCLDYNSFGGWTSINQPGLFIVKGRVTKMNTAITWRTDLMGKV